MNHILNNKTQILEDYLKNHNLKKENILYMGDDLPDYEIMQEVAPLGGMYQAGTLSGNPIAMAGGIATLTELKKQEKET